MLDKNQQNSEVTIRNAWEYTQFTKLGKIHLVWWCS